jgi:hypothetical protein
MEVFLKHYKSKQIHCARFLIYKGYKINYIKNN